MLRIFNARVLTKQGIAFGELWCEKGKIVAPGNQSAKNIDAAGMILAPGFIDLQINGAYGIDFTGNPEKIGEVARKLPAHGVTSFLPTIVSSPRAHYSNIIPKLQPRQISGGASILGVHLEGPFFNRKYAGAHSLDALASLEPSADLQAFYGSLAGVRIITLAPEIPYALEAMEKLHSHKIIIAIGHSAAPMDVIEKAIQRGAKLITHLFNAMPPFHHRSPGLIDAALIDQKVAYSLICDGIHLDHQAISLAWKLNPEKLILVSDAIAAMGAGGTDNWMLASQNLILKGRGAYVEDNTLAGSTYGIDAAVRMLYKTTGCTIQQAIEAASIKPAELLGISSAKGVLEIGCDADFILLDDALHVHGTFVQGERVH